MRPRRSSVVCRVALAGLLLALAPRTVRSQGGTLTQGALELLLPTGARAVAMGQAAVAGLVGSEGIWWNPALIATAPREFALHYAQSVAAVNDLTLTYIHPARYLGGLAVT